LSQPFLSTQGSETGADDVLRGRHLPLLEVDASGRADRIASDFGRFAKVVSPSNSKADTE